MNSFKKANLLQSSNFFIQGMNDNDIAKRQPTRGKIKNEIFSINEDNRREQNTITCLHLYSFIEPNKCVRPNSDVCLRTIFEKLL